MLCVYFSCVSWYFWYFGFLFCKHFDFQHSFRVCCIFICDKNWSEWFYKSNKTQSLPKIPPTSNNVDISPASFASKCAKKQKQKNALNPKKPLNHVNWSLGYLNSKMMFVNTDQHLRCREGASRGRCSWPVWQKADRARTPPRPERQKTSWKPQKQLKVSVIL